MGDFFGFSNPLAIIKHLRCSVMQSDRNSSKTDTFHKHTTYEVFTRSEEILTYAIHTHE